MFSATIRSISYLRKLLSEAFRRLWAVFQTCLIQTSVQILSLDESVSSQLVTWPTRTQVNPYPGSPLVTTFEKSTRNQSLGYELTHAF